MGWEASFLALPQSLRTGGGQAQGNAPASREGMRALRSDGSLFLDDAPTHHAGSGAVALGSWRSRGSLVLLAWMPSHASHFSRVEQVLAGISRSKASPSMHKSLCDALMSL